MMKTKAIAALVLAAGSFGFMANAQNNQTMQQNGNVTIKEATLKEEQKGNLRITDAKEKIVKERRHADGRKGGKFRKGDKKARMNAFQGIELSQEQKTSLEKLRTERKAEMGKLKEKSREERVKINQEYDRQLAKILTPEQMDRYKANMQQAQVDKSIKPGKGSRPSEDGKGKKVHDGKRSYAHAGKAGCAAQGK